MTIMLSVARYIFIIDFPDKVHLARWKYITPEEVQILQARIQADRGDAEYDPATLGENNSHPRQMAIMDS